MTESDFILEHLRGIQTQIDRLDRKLDALTGRFDTLEVKLDRLTLAVIAGFGSVVPKIHALEKCVSRLERVST